MPIETVRRTKDGGDLQVYLQVSPVVDESGKLIGISKFAFDCTEQAATRSALATSEARYRALVNASTEFVIITLSFLNWPIGSVHFATPSL